MGYKGVDTTELVLSDYRVPANRILGGAPGKGFAHMMDGVEVGRVNVAARACGIAVRAFELGAAYAQQRTTFGKPIAQHQAIQFKLAEMGVKVEAAHAMMVRAAKVKDAGRRNDLEAGMAKYLAAEYCKEVVEDSFRIHGGYGYSKEYEIERLYREAPMLLDRRGHCRDPEDDHRSAAARGLQGEVGLCFVLLRSASTSVPFARRPASHWRRPGASVFRCFGGYAWDHGPEEAR